ERQEDCKQREEPDPLIEFRFDAKFEYCGQPARSPACGGRINQKFEVLRRQIGKESLSSGAGFRPALVETVQLVFVCDLLRRHKRQTRIPNLEVALAGFEIERTRQADTSPID